MLSTVLQSYSGAFGLTEATSAQLSLLSVAVRSPEGKERRTVANQIPSAVVFGLRAPANILGKVVVFVECR
jgi:hypothetical protein